MRINSVMIRAMGKMGQHKAFWKFGIEEVLEKKKNTFVVSADLCAYSGLERIAEEHPEHFVNVGIQEQNMINVSAGMALEGNLVYTGSYAAFSVARPMEQIRNNLSVLQANVKIAGMCAGYNAESLGRSHWATEDIAMTRCLPGMVVLSPADSLEAMKACIAVSEFDGPAYIRLSYSANCPIVYTEDYDFKIGKAIRLCEGKDAAIFATGSMVHEVLEAKKLLGEKGISVSVINVHTLKPLDKKTVVETVEKFSSIFTVEEHNVIGGLGSAIAEVLSEINTKAKLVRMGMQDMHYALGDRRYIWQQAGLTKEQIAKKIEKTIGENK